MDNADHDHRGTEDLWSQRNSDDRRLVLHRYRKAGQIVIKAGNVRKIIINDFVISFSKVEAEICLLNTHRKTLVETNRTEDEAYIWLMGIEHVQRYTVLVAESKQ